jgi:FMN-dependent NADH-azoreductase
LTRFLYANRYPLRYLRWVSGFIGVTNPEFISADGIQVGPEHREKAVTDALQAASNLDAA